MHKPKDCRSCPVLRHSTGDCPLQPAARKYSNFDEQYNHCPLGNAEKDDGRLESERRIQDE